MSFGDEARYNFYFRAGDLESVRRVRAGDAKPDGSAGRHGHARGYKNILLGDHAHGGRTIRAANRAEVALDELSSQVQGCGIDSVPAVKKMGRRHVD